MRRGSRDHITVKEAVAALEEYCKAGNCSDCPLRGETAFSTDCQLFMKSPDRYGEVILKKPEIMEEDK